MVADNLLQDFELMRRGLVDVMLGNGFDHGAGGAIVEIDLGHNLVGEAADGQAADGTGHRHVDAKAVLKIHGEFQRHQ